MDILSQISKLFSEIAVWGRVHPGWSDFLQKSFFALLGLLGGWKAKSFHYKYTDKSQHKQVQKMADSPGAIQRSAEGDIIEDNSGNEVVPSILESPNAATTAAGGDITAPINQQTASMEASNGSAQYNVVAQHAYFGSQPAIGQQGDEFRQPKTAEPVLSDIQIFIYEEVKLIFNERGHNYDPRADYERAAQCLKSGSYEPAATLYIKIFKNALEIFQKIDRFQSAEAGIASLEESIKNLFDIRDGKHDGINNIEERFQAIEDAIKVIMSLEKMV